ncbi:hypothetical protein K7G98_16285, partial [Saccharothrix sp. MB29]|nr:hypothetical protein [Saccharothrix sp. MB29]
VVLDVSGGLGETAGKSRLRLEVTPRQVHVVRTDRTGQAVRTALCAPDLLSAPRAAALARVISPYRLGGVSEVSEPMVGDFDLPRLLGVADLDNLDPASLWRNRARSGAVPHTAGRGRGRLDRGTDIASPPRAAWVRTVC